MKLTQILMVMGILSASFAFGQSWSTIASDVTGDGYSGSNLDGTELAYWYDEPNDSLWFKLTCNSISAAQSANIGFNVMVNYPDGGSTFNFWGDDNMNPYHKLVTGWVTGSAPSSYSGTIGIANSSGVSGGDYDNLFSNNLSIIVNTSDATITVGMKRSDLIPDDAMGMAIQTAAAVGSSVSWNDDIYSSSGTMTITSTASVAEQNSQTFMVYPTLATDHIWLTVENELYNNAQILITGVSGKEYVNSKLITNSVDVSHLPAGVYIVSIIDSNFSSLVERKFVKK